MPSSVPRSIPQRRGSGPGPILSLIGFTVEPPPVPTPTGDRATVERLRRARAAGMTTFDVADSRDPARAELLLGAAFPYPDPDLVVIVGRRAEDLVARSGARRDLGAEVGLLERLRASLHESNRRLAPHRAGILEWRDPADARPTTGGPGVPGPPGSDVRWVFQHIAGPEALVPAPPAADDAPILLSGSLSLLDSRLARSLGGPSVAGRLSFLARDPFAGGRLDGTRFAGSGIDRGPERGPTRLRDLEAEFGPVLRLGHLTEGGERTLAQAALQYSAHWPWVASVIAPLPTGDRLEEILGALDTPPLRADELRRLGDPTAPPP